MKVDWEDREVSMGIFKAKYAKNSEETPEEFCERVASIVRPELHDFVKEGLEAGRFCFGGRTLYMAGRPEVKASSSNCYIMPMPEDDIESIYKSNAQMARVFSRGGGAGVNISKLRPKGARVRNAAETSTGAISFLELYNTTGNIIGARGRRAAEMVVLNCDHPDVEALLDMKASGEKLASMNISVLFTDEFMEAVLNNKKFRLHFECKDTGENIEKWIDARKFFTHFCEVAWDMGDPGVLFNDRIQQHNFNPNRPSYHISTSNPCSEFLGADYSSCNLGSINVYSFVRNKFRTDAFFDYKAFCETVVKAVMALNDVLSYGYDKQPLPENKKCIDDWRQIGLGLFGLADAFVALRIKYGSEESIKFVDTLLKTMHDMAVRASVGEAIRFGSYGKFFKGILPTVDKDLMTTEELDSVMKHGMANASLLSIAPTGTMSLFMGNFTGGCEPIFKLFYDRSTHKMEKTGDSFRVYARSIEDLLNYNGLSLDMSVEEIKEMFPWVVEAHDIPWASRVILQSTMQKYVDNAISSTVNLPHDATVDDVFNIYVAAWRSGCKGITVFRDGCRRGNILGVEEKKEKVEPKKAEPAPKKPTCSGDADYRECPECHEKLFKVEGHCGYCVGCGYSACGM